jgi:hypothetical protein
MLQRLLRVRSLEEEQLKTALESELAALQRLIEAQRATEERDRRGRVLVLESAQRDEPCDRLAGLEETRAARRLASALSIKIKTSEQRRDQIRTRYAAKRTERRQLRTLLDAAMKEEELRLSRHAQATLDDGHRTRVLRAAVKDQPATNDDLSARPDSASES